MLLFNTDTTIAQAVEKEGSMTASRYRICGDLDTNEPGHVDAAISAAIALNCPVVFPTFTVEQRKKFKKEHGREPQNFNDLHIIAGIDEVRRQLKNNSIQLFKGWEVP